VKLPWADEVRAARAAAIEAQRAVQDAGRIDAALRAVALVEGEVRAGREVASVPGGVELAEVVDAWPALAALREGDPAPGALRLADRRARLEAALAVLKPLGARMSERFEALRDLQLRQQEALATPRFRRSADAVRKRIEAQGVVEHELLPLENELVRLDLLATVLGAWLGAAEDADAGAPVREALAQSLVPMLDGFEAELAGSFAPGAVPPIPEWRALAGRVDQRRRGVRATAERVRRERDRLQSWLAERIG
jgi:hypothetical protein